MIINHYGLGMVKVALGERVIVFNPIGDKASREPVKFGADIALVSLGDNGYNGVRHVSRGERVPFVIDGPGEYEVDGNFIKGFATAGPAAGGQAGGRINTAYLLVLDGVRLVHLGALASAALPNEVVEALGAVDVLFLPLANLEAKAASKLLTLLKPRAVVPVDYDEKGLNAFLKDQGEEGNGVMEGWTFKKKDLSDKESQVMVVKSF